MVEEPKTRNFAKSPTVCRQRTRTTLPSRRKCRCRWVRKVPRLQPWLQASRKPQVQVKYQFGTNGDGFATTTTRQTICRQLQYTLSNPADQTCNARFDCRKANQSSCSTTKAPGHSQSTCDNLVGAFVLILNNPSASRRSHHLSRLPVHQTLSGLRHEVRSPSRLQSMHVFQSSRVQVDCGKASPPCLHCRLMPPRQTPVPIYRRRSH